MVNKYRNKKTHGFDSKLEERRWQVLKLAERQGLIFGLERQVAFELLPKQKGKYRNERKTEYKADFVYYKRIDADVNEYVVEDTKSEYSRKLPAYVLKRKLLLFRYGLSIREIKKDDIYDI